MSSRVEAPVAVRHRAWLDFALLGTAAVTVHGRSLWFGFTGLDDRDLVVDDQAFLAQPSALWRVFSRSYMHAVDTGHAYYRPVVTASFALDAQWTGANPVGYHATNVALHVLASCLLLALLRRLALGRAVSLAAALVFALHPALVPAVAWIPGRNDSLLAVYVLASLACFARDAVRPSWRDRAAHIALFALALLAKETAIVLPIVCVAYLALLEPELWKRERLRLVPAWAAAWATVIAARLALHPDGAGASLLQVVSGAPVLLSSLGSVALPLRPTVLAVTDDLPLWPGMVAFAAIGLAVWRVPGARWRVVAFGAAVFVLFLTPSLSVPGTLFLPQRLYLPACGVLVVLAEIVRALALERRVLWAFGGVTVTALALMAVAFEGAYRDPRAFAREAVAGSPHAALAHFCLGQSEQLAGNDDRAVAEYRTALALGPAEVVHNNIAVVAMHAGRWAEADGELRAELAINPRYGRAYYNLAIVMRREGLLTDACGAARRAANLAPDDEAARRERDVDCATAP